MIALPFIEFTILLTIVLALAKPLGIYMARVYEGRFGRLDRVFGKIERSLYRLGGIKPGDEMDWKSYVLAMLTFNLVGFVALYTLLRLQGVLFSSANPTGTPNPLLAFNTAISFVTNTNWQAYSGEQAMNILAQMLGLSVQNFLSAASGMAVLVALVRGFARRSARFIGNFWVDTVRGTLYILLPLSMVLALMLVSQGVVQTFTATTKVPLLQATKIETPTLDAHGSLVKDDNGNVVRQPFTISEQTLSLGPAASQIAIKHLGTNGGGFFNTNSAHPFENPTPLSNFLEMIAILLIPAALCLTFGEMVRDRRQGWAILTAMTVLLIAFATVAITSEQSGNPRLAAAGADQKISAFAPGGNIDRKSVV
jgi:K+-transporting ATPase ATPase A chain